MTPSEIFTRIDHVGIVVTDIDQALITYRDQLGMRVGERMRASEHGVELAFLHTESGNIELLAPLDEESGVARFLSQRGEGVHHICFLVDDIGTALDQLRETGVQLIDETPRQGAHGQVAFVHPRGAHGTLIELLQKEPDAH